MKPFLVLVLATVLVTSCTLWTGAPHRDAPPERWEPIFFKYIDETTRLSGIKPLREVSVSAGDLEVRIWRGFGLTGLEGVVLSRTGNIWSGAHVVSDENAEPAIAYAKRLRRPNSGSPALWGRLVELGILSLQDGVDESCYGGLDGIGHVVEINQDGVYRTYMIMSGIPNCGGSRKLDLIAETIGVEFYDGIGKCVHPYYKWFPCSEMERQERLKSENRQK